MRPRRASRAALAAWAVAGPLAALYLAASVAGVVSNADGLEPLAWLLAAAVVAGTAVLAARRRRAYLVAYLVGMLVWLVVLAGFLWWLSTQLTFTF